MNPYESIRFEIVVKQGGGFEVLHVPVSDAGGFRTKGKVA
jgi:hypothetical protein